MKMILAIVQPDRLARLRASARRFPGFPGMTIDKVQGFGMSDDDPHEPHSLDDEITDFRPRMRVMIVSPDETVAAILDMIMRCCHSGERGDGLVCVIPIESVHRIREAAPGQAAHG